MKTFVDTNVLIYAHDVDAGAKRGVASSLVRELWQARQGIISLQVLQEFYVNATRKIAKPIGKAEARGLLEIYSAWTVVAMDARDVRSATDIEDEFRLSFWDALIVTAALKANAEILLTEDMHAKSRIRGLEIRNPFANL
jgi:predicted nucleic acid-binding protein